MSLDKKLPFIDAADLVAEAHDADVLLINTSMTKDVAAQLADLCGRRRRRTNVILILVTAGGDAHAAYQIARCLLDSYERYILFLTGYCKSAGTLVAIGAHDLIVSRRGELGPLDVQMSKPDELIQRQSGLTANAALSTLHEQAFEAFEHFFLSLVRKSGSAITTRTATHVAVQLTSGLFAPIYEHVDPMHVGEAGLALQVAQQYGRLLIAGSGNLSAETLTHLTTGFPSHDFVIDYAQIERLFKRVRLPNDAEQALATILGTPALTPIGSGDRPIVAYLSTENTEPQAQQLPGLDAEDAHEQATDNDTPSPTTGTVDGGAAAAGQFGAPAHPHVASIGSGRAAGAGRRGQAS